MNRTSAARHVQTGSAPRRPGRDASGESLSRLFVLALLCAILPPIGLAFLWRSCRTSMAARVVLSIFSVCLMTVGLCAYMDRGEAPEILPVPVAPTSAVVATPVPAAAMAPAVSILPTNEGANANEGANGDANANQSEQDMQDDGYVYARTGDTEYYHAVLECGGQVNDRILTLSQAISEGLGPCGQCFTFE